MNTITTRRPQPLWIRICALIERALGLLLTIAFIGCPTAGATVLFGPWWGVATFVVYCVSLPYMKKAFAPIPPELLPYLPDEGWDEGDDLNPTFPEPGIDRFFRGDCLYNSED